MSEIQRYIKDGVIKKANKIIIKTASKVIINPTHERLLENGWEVYTTPELTEEELLNIEIRNKKQEISQYDSSENVNIFYIQDFPVWLDKATRAGLKLRFEAEIAVGQTETTLWYGNAQFPLLLEDAVKMLYAIEIYASKCYDNTQQHLANVVALTTIDEVKAYDYTTGYPEKLTF